MPGALVVWAAVVPLKQSITTLSEKLPQYWERVQKPLIKMEQQAVLSEEWMQEEVSAEIARETPKEGIAALSSLSPVRISRRPPSDVARSSVLRTRSRSD
jgi:predicted PurR-regulated permease PerM